LVVIPLAFVGDREAFYRRPPASAIIVHEWIWRRPPPHPTLSPLGGEGRVRGSAIVSWFLLKRLNLVMR
jgi:hypothetical protein